ncbi:MAG: hypothetical protein U9O64_03505 [Campylobacterota bacterium]|nr:hypothetical protein [Campylobacterota bacterium]
MSKFFKHLHDEEKRGEPRATNLSSKILAQRVTFGIFLLILLLFPHYAPWESNVVKDNTFIQQIFTLYFFIAYQTLGIVHEAGHGVCYILPCPQFVMVLNGTLFQLLFPGLIAYYYLRKGNLFAAYIALFFVGFSLHYTAWYISTAHEGLILPAHKAFLGVDAIHDFNYMLNTLGLLRYESFIAGGTRLIAYLVMLGAVVGMFFTSFPNKKNIVRKNSLKKKVKKA